MITSIVKANGADLYVERRGDGPPLPMIAGGGRDCGTLTPLADLLAAHHCRAVDAVVPHEPPLPLVLPDVFGGL